MSPAEERNRLYGWPGAEILYSEPEEAADAYDALEGEEFVIEEWTVHPPRHHLNMAAPIAWLLPEILDRVSEYGELSDGSDEWFDVNDTDIVAAANKFYDAIAATVKWRQADRKVGEWKFRQPPADDDYDMPILLSSP